jgi:hypothetical protein
MLRMSEYLSACFASSGDAVHVGRDGVAQRTAVVVARRRFWIERVQVRRTARQPDLDHRFGLGLGALWGGLGAAGHEEPGRARQSTAHRLAPRDRRFLFLAHVFISF